MKTKRIKKGVPFKLATAIRCQTHGMVTKSGTLQLGTTWKSHYWGRGSRWHTERKERFNHGHTVSYKTFRQLADACPKRKPR